MYTRWGDVEQAVRNTNSVFRDNVTVGNVALGNFSISGVVENL